ncbi:phage tail protein [Erwinia sp. QL-Z3]|uniref:phage tail protein n=1 Tax=Erwinia sp. QL-Z3 TaxID=2547962 RepID=UPI00107094FE|nr:phage tail protein [Erwinia sp. QL-Z3]QBR52656.1 phage tail protein [Erwinia sp. QL-Z3]
MAIKTFTWCPRINAQGDVKHRVRKAQFGDGYAQRSGDGINTRTQEWSLNFVGREDYISEIVAFLDEMGGSKAFEWKPPLYSLGLFTCEEYKPTAMGAGLFSLDATFEEAFKP